MLLLLILILFAGWIAVQHYRRVSRLPPGPFSFPIIGNIPVIFYYAWRAGGVIPMMNMLRKKYGKIFTIWIGPLPHVSITDFETCHEVFVKSGSRYSDKAFSPIFNEARNGFGLIAMNGPLWQEIRRFSIQTFRNMGIGKDLMELRIMSELDRRCEEFDHITEVNATEFFDLIVGSIINTILMGTRFDESNSDKFLHLKKLIEESTKVLTPIDLMLPTWFLRKFRSQRYNLMMKAHKDVMDYLSEDAVRRVEDVLNGRSTIDEENPRDYVDYFILKILHEGTDQVAYSIPSLKSVLTDLWIAGQETATTTLVSGFCQLLNHQHVMETLRSELMKVTANGSRPLTLNDKNSTPYLNAVIAEIQRHASILNINFFRLNHEQTEIAGFHVDAGALITAQLSSLHSDETVYYNPEEFDPERFLLDKGLAQKLIPFGVGKRACTGEALARAELYLIIGNLLLRYKFEPCGQLVSSIDDAPFSFAKKPREYRMKLIKMNFDMTNFASAYCSPLTVIQSVFSQ